VRYDDRVKNRSVAREYWPLGVLAIVFALKFVVLAQLWGHPLLQPDAGLDTTAYVTLAKRVLAGDVGLGPGLYYVSPLYIYFLALTFGLTKSFAGVQLVQIALGTATVGLVFLMGRMWGGARAGWISATLAAGCGVLTFHEIVLMQSALDPFLTACALTCLTVALQRSTARWFIAAGVCFGVQSLNRPQILFAALAIVLVLMVARRLKPAALLAVGLFVAMVPVAARNVAVAGQWSLVSSHGGLNFFIGNHAGATGLYQPVEGIRPEVEGQREDTRRVAEKALGRALTDAEVSDYFLDRGWQWLRAEPGAAAQLFARKLILALHADHVALPHSYEFFADDAKTALRWLIVNPWIIMPLGLAGLWCGRPRAPQKGADGFWIWAAFVPAYAAALAVFFLAERYRLPLLVPLCVSAGMCVDWVLSGIARSQPRSSGQWAGAACTLIVAAAIVNWPLNLADSREGDRLRMVLHAAVPRNVAEAERWASLAIASSTNPAAVEERVGRIFLRAAQPQEALRYLRSAQAHGGAGAELLVDLAEAQQQTGDVGGAAATLRSIEWSGATMPVLLRAGRVASAAGAKDVAVNAFAAATRVDAEAPEAWAQLGFALLFEDDLVSAERALLEAVRLKPADSVALGGLAVCAARLGRTDEALARADAALAIDPRDPLARQVRAALSGK